MDRPVYDKYVNAYFYKCLKCKKDICCKFINDQLCQTCSKQYDDAIEQVRKNLGIEECRYSEGEDAIKIKNKIQEFELKICDIKKQFNHFY